MKVSDIYYSLDQAQNPYPLTQVDFFHAKHRAVKKARADATAKGLPPPKSVASYMDIALVRNFGHYDDIGKFPNDPVARDLLRREAMEAVKAKRRRDAASKAHDEREEPQKQKSQHADTLHLRSQQQRISAREETKRRVREAFSWQPRTFTDRERAIHAPRKRKHADTADDGDANKMGAVSPASNSSKENSQAAYPAPGARKQRVVVQSDDEDKTSSLLVIDSDLTG
ncbi:hypothetical protein A1O7_01406 [Cladophialophora yegresii CBS 114405]|uniref:Uncharacterized protein n=1 Tax=Cladophialophora yegresii CBS 114405 TaxID=1182544 RepID=W9WKB4_9EURO|nr:uncharacterized protein A1O7_01406 [Cladophialophora yegresii CBS 114405]EXJ65066.1 hypothetical protein A1O7_01406 [Cladophialophora yegresii CBS 114405]